MALHKAVLPDAIISQLESVSKNVESAMGEMTRAGAGVVMQNLDKNMPSAIKNSQMKDNLKMTKTYKTPSDDGVNTKVGFYGYFVSRDGRRKPAPLVAAVFEHGRSTLPFPKQPFFRKSFKKKEIEEAMRQVEEDMLR